jgi:hypothetical protein
MAKGHGIQAPLNTLRFSCDKGTLCCSARARAGGRSCLPGDRETLSEGAPQAVASGGPVITFLTTDEADQAERAIMRREVEGLTAPRAPDEGDFDELGPPPAYDDERLRYSGQQR